MEEKQLTFQQAMDRLEEITNALNSSSLELEKAMDLFEEGLKLSKQCSNQLKEFEKRVDQLVEVAEDDPNAKE